MKKNENAKNYYVFIEQRNGVIAEVSLELVGEASRLASEVNYEVVGVLLGHNVSNLSNDLIAAGCDKVVVVDHPTLDKYVPEPYTKALSAVVNEFIPDGLFVGATTLGRDLGPRVAARVETGLTADATILEIDHEAEGKVLLITRPAFGGNLFGTIICPDHHPQMATVRPGVLQKLDVDTSRTGEVINFDAKLETSDVNLEILEEIERKIEGVDISKADIIISGGRGVGSKEGFAVLEECAKQLDAVVAGSRASVDAGWINKANQVGQTGKTVRPLVYVACGISGAVQHVAGMDQADLIIAINKDKGAPIFDVSHVSIVGDLFDVLPAVTKQLQSLKK